MNVFINGIGNVSPQNTLDNDDFLSELVNHTGEALYSVKPDYKSLIKGVNLRRMSRLLKNGTYSAQQCLADAGNTELDAIITGSGMGCLQDTEKFLANVYAQQEGVVSPTQFIQSTHNAMSGQIAMMLQCKKYNFTYTHRGSSFESALMDGMMLIEEEANHVLVGGLDELTDTYVAITNRMRLWKKEAIAQLELLQHPGKGSLAGEGAAFFMLGKQAGDKCYGNVKGMKMLFKPKSIDIIKNEIDELLRENNITIDQVDLVIEGLNGDEEIDKIYHELNASLFSSSNICYYKHLCGEFKTASAFGLWGACQILNKQHIPEVLKLNKFQTSDIKRILIYNNYNNCNHSVLLLEHVAT
jgi:3-oxoacyl-(acyl-carrier-protein) synthase